MTSSAVAVLPARLARDHEKHRRLLDKKGAELCDSIRLPASRKGLHDSVMARRWRAPGLDSFESTRFQQAIQRVSVVGMRDDPTLDQGQNERLHPLFGAGALGDAERGVRRR